MNINASIIDQRLDKIVEDIAGQARDELNIKDQGRLKSLAFVYYCVGTVLDLDPEQAFDCLTEGVGDFGIDALHISEIKNIGNETFFTVTLFQGKYKPNLKEDNAFPENAIKHMINALDLINQPFIQKNINERLKTKIEEIKSLSLEHLMNIRIILCNNGKKWDDSAQAIIDSYQEQSKQFTPVMWEYVNHDILTMRSDIKPIDGKLRLKGKVIPEDINFCRVLIGKISVDEIYGLVKEHGERLFDKNIRLYLGMKGNIVNENMSKTLIDNTKKENFYFFNNGITLICEKFTLNNQEDALVHIENLQIINGAQTCMTIFHTLDESYNTSQHEGFSNAYVLLRLYQLPTHDENLVSQITYATNSQNPVNLHDLKSNDDKQYQLEQDIKELGFDYRRKRSYRRLSSEEITPATAAEAIMSVWRKKPHKVKYSSKEHFGTAYKSIFTSDLNGSQLILAVLLYRIAEKRRKRLEYGDADFMRYGSCFVAMEMGKMLLGDLKLSDAKELTHKNFTEAKNLIQSKGSEYLEKAMENVQKALETLYNVNILSLQQLSATFRRADLLEYLEGYSLLSSLRN